MATTLKCLGQLHRKKWHQNESGIALETGYWPLRSGNGNEKMRSKEYPDGYAEKENLSMIKNKLTKWELLSTTTIQRRIIQSR
jgi:hypothetical protein